jgi:hypothetical protein
LNEQAADGSHGRLGALEALKEVAALRDVVSENKTAAKAFGPEDYEQLIALAWRHQFSEERTRFKRELRELQAHVTPRILANMERYE